jgi:Transposase DDE domain
MHGQQDGPTGAAVLRRALRRPGPLLSRGTFPYQKALGKRRAWVEPLFAEAKDLHGLRRFRLRRLEKVNGEALMTAAGQNVKRRLLTFGRKGPRRPVQVASLRVPEAARRSPHRTPLPLRNANFRRSEPFSTGWQAKSTRR